MADEQNEPKQSISDAGLIQLYKEKFKKRLDDNSIDMKVSDLVKIFEVQQKLATSKGAQEQFWELIEQLRQEELKNGK